MADQNQANLLAMLQNRFQTEDELGKALSQTLESLSGEIDGFFPRMLEAVINGKHLDLRIQKQFVRFLADKVLETWNDQADAHWYGKVAKRHTTSANSSTSNNLTFTDKQALAESIVKLIVQAADVLRNDLCIVVGWLLDTDGPERWSTIAGQTMGMFLSANFEDWLTATQLMVPLTLHKSSEHEKSDFSLQSLFSILLQRCQKMLDEQHESEKATWIPKMALDLFLSFTDSYIPQKKQFLEWMEIVKRILQEPFCVKEDENIPEDHVKVLVKVSALEVAARPYLPSPFEDPIRSRNYKDLMKWYTKNHAPKLLDTILKSLLGQTLKRDEGPAGAEKKSPAAEAAEDEDSTIYPVSRPIVKQSLEFLLTITDVDSCWKSIKDRLPDILKLLVFPLVMQKFQEEKNLWKSNLEEYIVHRFGRLGETRTFQFEATNCEVSDFIQYIVFKRCDALGSIISTLVDILKLPHYTSAHKEVALHILGTLSWFISKEEALDPERGHWLYSYVVPHVSSAEPKLRLRSLHTLTQFSRFRCFKKQRLIQHTVNSAIKALLTDSELPVQVEAVYNLSIVSQNHKEEVKAIFRPHVHEVLAKAFELFLTHGNTTVSPYTLVYKLIDRKTFRKDIANAISNICNQLGHLLTNCDASSNGNPLTSRSYVLIELIWKKFKRTTAIIKQVEPVYIKILHNLLMSDMSVDFRRGIQLALTMTKRFVPPSMWDILDLVLERYTTEFLTQTISFHEISSLIHKFITVDPAAFVSNEEYITEVINACKLVLKTPPSNNHQHEHDMLHAYKLIEVLILSHPNQINLWIDNFMDLAVTPLIQNTGINLRVRAKCFLIVLAVLHSSWEDFLTYLQSRDTSEIPENWLGKCLEQNASHFAGIHDRKVLVIALSTTLIHNPSLLSSCITRILPTTLDLLNNISHVKDLATLEFNKKAAPTFHYQTLADATLGIAERDEIQMSRAYSTPIEQDKYKDLEFIIFAEALTAIRTEQAFLYKTLISDLTPLQLEALKDILKQHRTAQKQKIS